MYNIHYTYTYIHFIKFEYNKKHIKMVGLVDELDSKAWHLQLPDYRNYNHAYVYHCTHISTIYRVGQI